MFRDQLWWKNPNTMLVYHRDLSQLCSKGVLYVCRVVFMFVEWYKVKEV